MSSNGLTTRLNLVIYFSSEKMAPAIVSLQWQIETVGFVKQSLLVSCERDL